MPNTETMVWMVAYATAAALVAVVAYAAWDVTRLLRAHRRMAKVLAEREEYRPLLYTLIARARQNGGILQLSERESLDARERVREGLIFLEPGDRKRIEERLRGRTAREGYLRNLLCTSMNRMERVEHHA
jgi:biopolymer transport protein ExbB/TolQ